jgi:tetratricopeptide (TPR) repeat protein
LALAEPWSLLEAAQVLAGERFSHPLMLDAARALVPAALQRSLHARAALLLQADALVPPARLAWHWQEGERWAEAGDAWHRAGAAARCAGRLLEQQQLLERAAACQRKAGCHAAEFAAVHEAMHGLQLRAGGAAVLAALPRLEALSTDDDSRLRCALVQVEALLDLERDEEARATAARALTWAQPRHPLRADALALQAMAEAQGGHHAVARRLGDAAVKEARVQHHTAQELRTQRSLAYVLYAAGALGDALPVQQRARELAAALGDEAERASAEAAMGALLATTGDVPASYRHAHEAHRSYAEMGLAANSTVGTINLMVLGNAAAYLGRFDEALQHLQAAERMASSEAAVNARAKARISLAGVWLTLGQPAAAAALVTDLPAGTMVAMRMQAALILAQAAQMEGASGEAALARLGRLGAEHPGIPPTQGAWIEWSHQGPSGPVLARLAEVHAAFVAQGLVGTARVVRLRQVARWLDLADAGDDKALQHAGQAALDLLPHVATGLHARSYPPAAWVVLARALERCGQTDAATRSRAAARDWVQNTALPHVPEAHWGGFLQRNPDNRALLMTTAGRARA